MALLRSFILPLAAGLLAGCGHASSPKVIVIAVDGMDPGFVEGHWADLPHLVQLRNRGGYSRLRTTTPPQSPVAWSTFITGLDPAEHGIFDFIHRDPATGEPYLSTTGTMEPRFHLALGQWDLPLSRSRAVSLRRGRAFWEILADRGVPVTVLRLPSNYPPSDAGHEIAGMGTPDLRGTEGTFTFFTSDPIESTRAVPGGLIRKIDVAGGHVDVTLEGPPNPLRRDHAYATAPISIDVDAERPYARIKSGGEMAVLKEGEWSGWLRADFVLLPHMVTARGMVRVFLKQVRPSLEVYFSPVNADPASPAFPIATPSSHAGEVAGRIGRFSTLGIPEDTAVLRAGIFDLPQFLWQSRLVFDEEQRLLNNALGHFTGGLLISYISAIDQSSHMLWGRHEPELLAVYRAVDATIGEVMRREPDAELVVMSDHGFTMFDRAVNLNTWLARNGFKEKAYALGLNGLYLRDRYAGDQSLLEDLRRKLLDFRDPDNGRQVISAVVRTNAAPENRAIAPDLIVGYAAGYRASWQTAAGEAPDSLIDNNDDAWIGDHCVDPAVVPGVLFASKPVRGAQPELKDLAVSLLAAYGVAQPSAMKGRAVF